jgi:hypothetical protein
VPKWTANQSLKNKEGSPYGRGGGRGGRGGDKKRDKMWKDVAGVAAAEGEHRRRAAPPFRLTPPWLTESTRPNADAGGG